MIQKKQFFTAAMVCALSTAVCLADATVDQKSKVQFGGALGGLINTFGGRATRDGISSTIVVKGDRKLTRHDDNGELVDLREEKIYNIDYARKTYTVMTFAEMRKRMEDAQKQAKDEASSSDSKKEKEKGPEYEVDFDIKNTGKTQTINGFDTKEVVATVTVREKGKKLEQSGGVVMTTDMWMGPKLAAMKEVTDFDRRFYQKLYGEMLGGADVRQMAMLMASSPAFGKAMKAFNDKKGSFEGTPVQTNMLFETVAGTEQRAEQKDEEASNDTPAAMLGGLLGRAMKKRQQSSEPEKPMKAGHAMLFDSRTELLQASSSADASAVSIPAGFKLRS